MYFLETSAKEAENVETLFIQIAGDLIKVKFPFWDKYNDEKCLFIWFFTVRGNWVHNLLNHTNSEFFLLAS